MVEVISANGKRIAVATEHKNVEVRTRQGDAAGKRQRASMDVMGAIGPAQSTGAELELTNARDRWWIFSCHILRLLNLV